MPPGTAKPARVDAARAKETFFEGLADSCHHPCPVISVHRPLVHVSHMDRLLGADKRGGRLWVALCFGHAFVCFCARIVAELSILQSGGQGILLVWRVVDGAGKLSFCRRGRRMAGRPGAAHRRAGGDATRLQAVYRRRPGGGIGRDGRLRIGECANDSAAQGHSGIAESAEVLARAAGGARERPAPGAYQRVRLYAADRRLGALTGSGNHLPSRRPL
jgi:hypothetical protein